MLLIMIHKKGISVLHFDNSVNRIVYVFLVIAAIAFSKFSPQMKIRIVILV
jgi:hypothetical protein